MAMLVLSHKQKKPTNTSYLIFWLVLYDHSVVIHVQQWNFQFLVLGQRCWYWSEWENLIEEKWSMLTRKLVMFQILAWNSFLTDIPCRFLQLHEFLRNWKTIWVIQPCWYSDQLCRSVCTNKHTINSHGQRLGHFYVLLHTLADKTVSERHLLGVWICNNKCLLTRLLILVVLLPQTKALGL